MLDNEIRSMVMCGSHPNIVDFHDLKKTTNNIYVIMEYCDQGNLKDYIKNNKVTMEESIDFFI